MKKIYLTIIVLLTFFISAQAAGITWGGINAQGIEHIGVNYYPNPFNDQLKVEWSVDNVRSVSLYNLLGIKMLELPTDGDSRSAVLNTSNLGDGVYFLQVKTDTGFETFRVVK